jgi:hypothetical protein
VADLVARRRVAAAAGLRVLARAGRAGATEVIARVASAKSSIRCRIGVSAAINQSAVRGIGSLTECSSRRTSPTICPRSLMGR